MSSIQGLRVFSSQASLINQGTNNVDLLAAANAAISDAMSINAMAAQSIAYTQLSQMGELYAITPDVVAAVQQVMTELPPVQPAEHSVTPTPSNSLPTVTPPTTSTSLAPETPKWTPEAIEVLKQLYKDKINSPHRITWDKISDQILEKTGEFHGAAACKQKAYSMKLFPMFTKAASQTDCRTKNRSWSDRSTQVLLEQRDKGVSWQTIADTIRRETGQVFSVPACQLKFHRHKNSEQ